MTELKTRLLLRHDSTENWEGSDLQLKAGEAAVEFTNGGKAKLKVATVDGQEFVDAPYIGGEEANIFQVTLAPDETDVEAAIAAAVGTTEIAAGDIAIVRATIYSDSGNAANNKYSYTGYVYDGTKWKAMDGNYNAKNVYFDDDLVYTANIGVKTVPASGSGTITAAGKNVKEVFASILAEEKNPNKTAPAVTLNVGNLGTYEIGTKKTLTHTATLSAGSYTYGPATGITAQTWSVSCTGIDAKNTTSTGSFVDVVAEASAKTVTAVATYNEGAVPKTNLGNDYPAGKIAAGSASKTSGNYQGVRYMFWGPVTTDIALNSANIRGLKYNKATGTGNLTTFGAGAGAVKVIVAVPAGRKISKVIMPSALNADVTALFVKQGTQVQVNGANDYAAAAYDVYVYQPASIDAGETYTVTIG